MAGWLKTDTHVVVLVRLERLTPELKQLLAKLTEKIGPKQTN